MTMVAAPRGGSRGGSRRWAGTWRLTRFALRRDRVLLAVWLFLLTLLCYASAAATPSLYTTERSRVVAADLINSSPAAVALYGPILDPRSIGELSMTKTTVLYAVFVMGLALVLVRRHTRTEEETGRQELLAAALVGRHAPLAAAVAEAALVMVGLAALAALADALGGLPVAGSLLFGASWLGSGLVGIGIAAVACQLSASTRTCALVAASAFGVLYLMRAAGDVSAEWLSWLTPLGWNTRLRAWSDPRWWVLALYLLLAAALVTVAFVLRSRRDLGSGLLADRPGPAQGSPRLRDVLALTLRVHSHALAAWTVAAAVMGAVFGSLVPNLGTMFESTAAQEMLARLGGTGVVENAMLAAIMSVVAMVLTGFAITVAAHGGTDETAGRTEAVLATATPRSLSFGAVTLVAVAGSTWLLLVTGLATGLGYGAQEGLGGIMGRTLGATMAQAPAVWLVATLSLLCLALGSRWASAGWALLAAFVTVGLVGELLRLPGWVVGLSPFQHVAKVPSEPMAWGSALLLTALALVVGLVAWRRFNGRDIG